ncbi:MAG: hypothetical protein CMB73_08565, partial [Euryarchaeota archaeon]|nr:hypothetical protein [Euryarchaeota archaeon]
RIPSSPRQNEADADGDLHNAGDEHPNGWVAQHGWNDGFEPSGVGEVLDTNVQVHQTEHKAGSGQDPASHIFPS